MIRRRFKYFMPERNEVSTKGEETLLSVSEYYGVKPRSEAFDADAAEGRATSLEGYRKVKAGDFVMNYMLAWKGAYGVSDYDGIVSPAYAVYRIDPRYADRRFIHHRLRSEHMRSIFRARSKGIIESRLRLYPDAFLSLELELPDLDTQKAIAGFLDRETALIDQLIEKKQRLVELQKIRRLSEVSQLLCRGTRNPTGWKPSGLDWMADIPQHWQWVRMKDVCSEIIDCKNRTPPQVDEGQYWVIRTTCIKDGQFVHSGGYPTDEAAFREWTKRGKPSPGDVLITREAPMGEACLYPDGLSACLGQRMMLYRPDPKIVRATYLVHTIYSAIGQHYVGLRRKGSTVGHLRVPEVYNFPCLLPPLDEQDEILARLDANLDTYTKLGESIRASITRLQEYRSALITAAVTGQIDVATWGKRGRTDHALERIEADLNPTAIERAPISRNWSRARRLVAAEIVYAHRNIARFGRIKLHKIMYLAETHANLNEIEGCYRRHAAGPYDEAMIQDVETGLRQDQFYDAVEDTSSDHGQIVFEPLKNVGQHRPELEKVIGNRLTELRRLIGLLADFSTEDTEAIVTLYAVWNDALLDGETPDDARIIRGFRQEWHDAKLRFTEEKLRIWLGWMRRNDLVPRGAGPHTISMHQPRLFD